MLHHSLKGIAGHKQQQQQQRQRQQQQQQQHALRGERFASHMARGSLLSRRGKAQGASPCGLTIENKKEPGLRDV